MNLLIDTLPTSLEVNGKDYPIRSDFRDCLRVLIACADNELTSQEKCLVVLGNIYLEVPDDLEEASNKANWFLNGGKDNTVSTGESLFSWDKDSNLIYAAFRQTHHIDLSKEQLHWWEFLALFMDMGQDTAFCQLTSLRSRVKSGKASKEEVEAAQKMGDAFEIPEMDDRTLDEKIRDDEKEKEFLKLLGAR